MKVNELKTYEIAEEKRIKELNSTGTILKHKKSGARIFLLSNDDENKVFSIGFRTPPGDSTGVPHILEHSVLCGSRKFPAKDPFVELVKGSLNTFLNAMTYPDKTVYPVASCNEKDFQNLMDVYLDSVFYPNIYNEKKIFEQEGWHYELESPEAPITYNGVVFNEMKGAFSDPDSVLDRYTRHILFPDNAYGNESGGDPDVIPELTYEEFLAFHKKYYHPSNSYIYLYGDMDMAEKLQWLDKEYLSAFDEAVVDSQIPFQTTFDGPKEKEIFYSITEDESEENASYLSLNTVVGTDTDKYLYVAFQILEYALIGTPGAVLKKALIDAGIGDDIQGGFESGILQPYFSIIAKNANKEQKDEFLSVIKDTLKKIAKEGMDKKSLLAGINFYEFRYREADYGSFPKGLMYGLQSFDSWLFDETQPMVHLEYEETFEYLKKQVDFGYFEKLIQDYLLDNSHEVMLIASPERGLSAKKDSETAKKLEALKQSLSDEEIQKLVAETKALKAYQDEPSKKEDLEKIPLLQREDIGREPTVLLNDVKAVEGVKVIHHNMLSSGIGYIRLMFDMTQLPMEDLLYAGLLKSVLGYVDTENYTYDELFNEINIESGGIRIGVNTYGNLEEPKRFAAMFEVNCKVLYEKMDFGFRMMQEILCGSKLEDEKRLGEIIAELKSKGQSKLNGASHSAAVLRAASYSSPSSYFDDMIGGITYYKFLEELAENFEIRKAVVIEKLKNAAKQLLIPENLTISFVGDETGFEYLEKEIPEFKKNLFHGEKKVYEWEFPMVQKNEGFKTSSSVNYVARYGNFRKSGHSYTGVLKVLKVILSYDYLWINLRVKGGAYGCMSGFGRSGEGYFVSYRDPNLGKSNQIYEEVVDYIRSFDVDERDMTKYIIGTISNLDTPLNPSARGSLSLSAYLSGVTQDMLKQEREEILNAAAEDIRSLADIAAAVLAPGNICVIGNNEQIEEEKELFKEVKNLFK